MFLTFFVLDIKTRNSILVRSNCKCLVKPMLNQGVT